ncbi:MAG: hypothetical protein ACOY3I_08025 [Verrucomicrobiota bacterium]
MKRIKTSELQAGMVIAEDVFGSHGELLIPKGSQADDRSLKTLNHWNILHISVEGEAEDAFKVFSPEQIAEVEKEITSKFITEYKDNTTVTQLIQKCVLRALQKKFATVPSSSAPATPPPATPVQPAPQPATTSS